MTGRDIIKALAEARGLSERTARRYLQAGIDLSDADAVDAHKYKLRSRFGVSKVTRRKLAEPSPTVRQTREAELEGYIDRLESVICDCHFIAQRVKNHHPQVAADMGSILEETTPAMVAIGARDEP